MSHRCAIITDSPRAAYVHIPFCRHRCGYCNFTVVAGRDQLIDAFLTAIDRELSGLESPRQIDTLYFGGGTPTHLSLGKLRQLLEMVRHWFLLADGYEWTVEANPTDFSREKAKVLAAYGVTRISLGAQSFDTEKLWLLERDHQAGDIRHAFELARTYLAVVSLDLIFGVPGETLSVWRADLDSTLSLGPDHVSTYGLTFERGTSFWSRLRRGELSRVNESLELAMYELAIQQLIEARFEHYEVSNFARPGQRCRHNEAYWLGRPCYAFGPGASRFVDGCRETNHRSTTEYLKRVAAGMSPVAERERLAPEDAARERLVFGLRRLEGVDSVRFAEQTGFRITELAGNSLDEFLRLGLLEWAGTVLRLTRLGLMVSDAIWPDFLRT